MAKKRDLPLIRLQYVNRHNKKIHYCVYIMNDINLLLTEHSIQVGQIRLFPGAQVFNHRGKAQRKLLSASLHSPNIV